MEGADAFKDQLDRMSNEAEQTERRTDSLIDSLGVLRPRSAARETKTEAEGMMKTYLEGEEEALDGSEFLTMAEAGELGHWEIVQTMSRTLATKRSASLRAGR
jgi:hypothetical protein